MTNLWLHIVHKVIRNFLWDKLFQFKKKKWIDLKYQVSKQQTLLAGLVPLLSCCLPLKMLKTKCSYPASLVARGGQAQYKDIHETFSKCWLDRARPPHHQWQLHPRGTAHGPGTLTLGTSVSSKEHLRGSKMGPSMPCHSSLSTSSPGPPWAQRLKNQAMITCLESERLSANYLTRFMLTFHLQVFN